MKDSQSLLLLIAGAAVGFALGAAWEHERLIAEIKGIKEQHEEDTSQVPA